MEFLLLGAAMHICSLFLDPCLLFEVWGLVLRSMGWGCFVFFVLGSQALLKLQVLHLPRSSYLHTTISQMASMFNSHNTFSHMPQVSILKSCVSANAYVV